MAGSGGAGPVEADLSGWSFYACQRVASGYDGAYNWWGLVPSASVAAWLWEQNDNGDILPIVLGIHGDLGGRLWSLDAKTSTFGLMDSRYSATYVSPWLNMPPRSVLGKYLMDHNWDPANDDNYYIKMYKDGQFIWSANWGIPSSQLPPNWSNMIVYWTEEVSLGGYSQCSAMYSCYSATKQWQAPLIDGTGRWLGAYMRELWSMISGPWPADMDAPWGFGCLAVYTWSGYA